MRIEELKYKDITREIVDKVLYENMEYTGETAEIAIVLGSSKATKYRIPMAVKLYQENKIQKILCCGGRKFNEYGKKTEAFAMKEKAIELGVKEDDILIESESETTKENILNAVKAIRTHCNMDRMNQVILVTTSFHMKRSILLAEKYFPKHVKIIPCPADDIKTRRDTWYQNKVGYERAVGEVIGIADYARKKEIEGFEIITSL